jgi:hypothetical protein
VSIDAWTGDRDEARAHAYLAASRADCKYQVHAINDRMKKKGRVLLGLYLVYADSL